jgi:hypothetical protein
MSTADAVYYCRRLLATGKARLGYDLVSQCTAKGLGRAGFGTF